MVLLCALICTSFHAKGLRIQYMYIYRLLANSRVFCADFEYFIFDELSDTFFSRNFIAMILQVS